MEQHRKETQEMWLSRSVASRGHRAVKESEQHDGGIPLFRALFKQSGQDPGKRL